MGDKKKLPQGLTEKQELQRQETINKVLWAVADIKSERGKITISTLAEYAGLSRSTFAKSHIRELLVEHGHASRDVAAVLHKRKKANQVRLLRKITGRLLN